MIPKKFVTIIYSFGFNVNTGFCKKFLKETKNFWQKAAGCHDRTTDSRVYRWGLAAELLAICRRIVYDKRKTMLAKIGGTAMCPANGKFFAV